MNTEELLNLNFKNKKSRQKAMKALYTIKPFFKYKEESELIPIEDIEKLIYKLCKKYMVAVQSIQYSILKDGPYYSSSIVIPTIGEWLGTVYGESYYELWCKLAIKLWYLTRIEKLELRADNET